MTATRTKKKETKEIKNNFQFSRNPILLDNKDDVDDIRVNLSISALGVICTLSTDKYMFMKDKMSELEKENVTLAATTIMLDYGTDIHESNVPRFALLRFAAFKSQLVNTKGMAERINLFIETVEYLLSISKNRIDEHFLILMSVYLIYQSGDDKSAFETLYGKEISKLKKRTTDSKKLQFLDKIEKLRKELLKKNFSPATEIQQFLKQNHNQLNENFISVLVSIYSENLDLILYSQGHFTQQHIQDLFQYLDKVLSLIGKTSIFLRSKETSRDSYVLIMQKWLGILVQYSGITGIADSKFVFKLASSLLKMIKNHQLEEYLQESFNHCINTQIITENTKISRFEKLRIQTLTQNEEAKTNPDIIHVPKYIFTVSFIPKHEARFIFWHTMDPDKYFQCLCQYFEEMKNKNSHTESDYAEKIKGLKIYFCMLLLDTIERIIHDPKINEVNKKGLSETYSIKLLNFIKENKIRCDELCPARDRHGISFFSRLASERYHFIWLYFLEEHKENLFSMSTQEGENVFYLVISNNDIELLKMLINRAPKEKLSSLLQSFNTPSLETDSSYYFNRRTPIELALTIDIQIVKFFCEARETQAIARNMLKENRVRALAYALCGGTDVVAYILEAFFEDLGCKALLQPDPMCLSAYARALVSRNEKISSFIPKNGTRIDVHTKYPNDIIIMVGSLPISDLIQVYTQNIAIKLPEDTPEADCLKLSNDYLLALIRAKKNQDLKSITSSTTVLDKWYEIIEQKSSNTSPEQIEQIKKSVKMKQIEWTPLFINTLKTKTSIIYSEIWSELFNDYAKEIVDMLSHNKFQFWIELLKQNAEETILHAIIKELTKSGRRDSLRNFLLSEEYPDKKNILHYAVENISVMKLILSHLHKIHTDHFEKFLTKKDRHGMVPLHFALISSPEMMDLLCETNRTTVPEIKSDQTPNSGNTKKKKAVKTIREITLSLLTNVKEPKELQEKAAVYIEKINKLNEADNKLKEAKENEFKQAQIRKQEAKAEAQKKAKENKAKKPLEHDLKKTSPADSTQAINNNLKKQFAHTAKPKESTLSEGQTHQKTLEEFLHQLQQDEKQFFSRPDQHQEREVIEDIRRRANTDLSTLNPNELADESILFNLRDQLIGYQNELDQLMNLEASKQLAGQSQKQFLSGSEDTPADEVYTQTEEEQTEEAHEEEAHTEVREDLPEIDESEKQLSLNNYVRLN